MTLAAIELSPPHVFAPQTSAFLDGTLTVSAVADLAEIYRADVDVVRLVRSECGVDGRALAELASLDFVVALRGRPEDLDLGIVFPGNTSTTASRFREDLSLWLTVFADLVEARDVGLRIACSDKAMCPRFHFDKVPVRFVSAYVGTGTEWLGRSLAANVRPRLRVSSGDAELGVLEREIQRANALDWVLLKGDAYPAHEGLGTIHRSPRVQSGSRRLLVSLDVL
jgi:hypothetical protein